MSIEDVIEFHKNYAKFLLEDDEVGEFYPFAHGITEKNKAITVMVKLENDFPTVLEVIAELKSALPVSHADNKFKIVTITTDVKYTPYGSDIKTDAIEIAMNFKNGITIKYYAPYEISGNKVQFDEFGWPEFSSDSIIFDSVNFAERVFILTRILENDASVLYVIHDHLDQWQFVDGDPVEVDEITTIDLNRVLRIDASVLEVLDLEKGYEATRETLQSKWTKFKSN